MPPRRKTPAASNTQRHRGRKPGKSLGLRPILFVLLGLVVLWGINHYTSLLTKGASRAGEETRTAVAAAKEKADEVGSTIRKKAGSKASKGAKPGQADYDFTKAPGFQNPEPKKGYPIVRHTYYTLAYDEAREQAQWVAYELKGEYVTGIADRKDLRFVPDPKVPTQSADPVSYRNSGYDKGHLVPAADMKFSQQAMLETFYTSNICPQLHSFNAGVWEKIEKQVRNWARREERVFVITGPIFYKPNGPVIGNKDQVAVPDAFFKVVLDADGENRKAIGFIVPHEDRDEPIYNFAVTIDEVEKVAGLDFWPLLPDPLEQELESQLDIAAWKKAVPIK